MGEWLPIETAPKDGRLILVFEPTPPGGTRLPRDGNGTNVAYWADWERWVEPHENYFSFDPTHWQPLPEPPKE